MHTLPIYVHVCHVSDVLYEKNASEKEWIMRIKLLLRKFHNRGRRCSIETHEKDDEDSLSCYASSNLVCYPYQEVSLRNIQRTSTTPAVRVGPFRTSHTQRSSSRT